MFFALLLITILLGRKCCSQLMDEETDLVQFSSVQWLSCVRFFVTPWITAHQTSLSVTNSRSSLKLMSIKSVTPSSHLILCHPLLLLPPVPASIRIFSSESTLHLRWPKYWSFWLVEAIFSYKARQWMKEYHWQMWWQWKKEKWKDCLWKCELMEWL